MNKLCDFTDERTGQLALGHKLRHEEALLLPPQHPSQHAMPFPWLWLIVDILVYILVLVYVGVHNGIYLKLHKSKSSRSQASL